MDLVRRVSRQKKERGDRISGGKIQRGEHEMFYLAKPFDLFNKQLTGFWFLFSRPPHESHEQPMAADRQWTDHFSQSLHRARLHFL